MPWVAAQAGQVRGRGVGGGVAGPDLRRARRPRPAAARPSACAAGWRRGHRVRTARGLGGMGASPSSLAAHADGRRGRRAGSGGRAGSGASIAGQGWAAQRLFILLYKF